MKSKIAVAIAFTLIIGTIIGYASVASAQGTDPGADLCKLIGKCKV